MAEPLKNLIHPGLVEAMGNHIGRHASTFDRKRFTALATKDMESLELMQRALQISDALEATLPEDFPEAAALLSASLPHTDRPGLAGWMLLPVNQYIARRGLDDFEISLALLKELTRHFTAEFGIRTFIHADQDRALAEIAGWVRDANHHVRRLASEGTRPRLPWAMRLPKLIADPQPILPILETLLDDPEDYVRRSVANSLNDIAKDHPDLVAEFVARHIVDASPERTRLLRHASRTLLKKGHAGALGNFGFGALEAIAANLAISTPKVVFGDGVDFTLSLENTAAAAQQAMIDYAVHHRKANGTLAPKVFKWKSLMLRPDETVNLSRRHALRPITTRQYYPGTHRIDILVNGVVVASGDFELSMD
ncbi:MULTISPECIES: DNA alkylation repair protein [unclassified Rhizobium]|uniref:DNA alkylation repair protein n=1 Tax=unclassified Rhizobium TaxID=2613769 RepID=UPI0006FCEA39|nr:MULTISPECIES: DNA alkylation repair protein [unclassified Rhizobium]KQV38210.1 DNA alkylation repair protein [Rhizobium sp. Root1212]KRD30867.1 DNA alkylation repair protein [Rhizobium sp. Root268]